MSAFLVIGGKTPSDLGVVYADSPKDQVDVSPELRAVLEEKGLDVDAGVTFGQLMALAMSRFNPLELQYQKGDTK